MTLESDIPGDQSGNPDDVRAVQVAARTVVNVQRAGNDTRIKAEVLGSVPGAYIVFRDIPNAQAGHNLQAIQPRVGDTLLVRFLQEGVVFGFRAAVARFVAEPEYLLFVHYPHQVEHASVRQYRRWACNVPGTMAVGEAPLQVVVTDISARGCGIAGMITEEPPPPAKDDVVVLALQTPDTRQAREIRGTLRRIDEGERIWQAGVVFDEPNDGLLEALMPYLLIEAELQSARG